METEERPVKTRPKLSVREQTQRQNAAQQKERPEQRAGQFSEKNVPQNKNDLKEA